MIHPDTIGTILREFYLPILKEQLGDIRLSKYDGKGYYINSYPSDNPDEPPVILSFTYKFYVPGPLEWEYGTISFTPTFLESVDPKDFAYVLKHEVEALLDDWKGHRRSKLGSG